MDQASLCLNQKKNTIDPENIILNYGADAARLFILSDSPPEKDVQWSEEGIISSFKFIQKLWNLNIKINDEIKKNHPKNSSNDLTKYTHKFIKKITDNLNHFSYNVIIANLHEAYSFLNKEILNKYTQDTLKENYKKILTTILPIIPHFSSECLNLLEKKYKPKWPVYDEKFLEEKEINIVIQINGKKRGLITAKKDVDEKELFSLISMNKALYKYIKNEKIKKNIFIKNKLINIII